MLGTSGIVENGQSMTIRYRNFSNKRRFLINAGRVGSILYNKHRVSIKRWGSGTISMWQILVTLNENEQESVHH